MLKELFHRKRQTIQETLRQIGHAGFGIVYAYLFLEGLITPTRSFVLLSAVVILGFSLYTPPKHRWLRWILEMERPQALEHLPLQGVIFYLLGVSLTITFFDFVPAICGILTLAILDSVSTLYGSHLGKVSMPWSREKHLEGPVLGALLSSLVCSLFIPFWPALAASSLAGLIDTLSLKIGLIKLDDNLLIPLLSAAMVQALT